MPTEAELSAWLRDPRNRGVSAIDPAAVIRSSKRRRLPKLLAVGGALSIAVAGFGVAGISGFQSLTPGDGFASSAGSSSESTPESAPGAAAEEDSGATDTGIGSAPAEKINLCGGEVADVAPSPTGLVLTTDFPSPVPAGAEQVDGTVTLTNTGTETIVGTTAASPAVTISQGGVVLWHSNGPMIMLAVMVDLAPGESMEYSASFTPVRCGVEDDAAESFRPDLPPLGAGVYQVSAAIDLIPEGAEAGAPAELITGPTADITLD